MRPLCWWLAGLISLFLDRDERDAVWGDLSESGETGGQALRDVLGLVIRRQAALGMTWQLWVTLLGLVFPVGMLLSFVSRQISGFSAVYIWMYANNWHMTDLWNTGFRHEFGHSALFVLMQYLMLVCWSWTGGFVLGLISRRKMIQLNGLLLFLTLWLAQFVGVPWYLEYQWRHLHQIFGSVPRLPDPNAPVFALVFYRLMFPLTVQALLVVAPALWAMRQGLAVASFPPIARAILWTAALATLAGIVCQSPPLWLLRGASSWQMQLLQAVGYWPVIYWFANTVARRRHEKLLAI